MLSVVAQMWLPLACGIAWRIIRPGGLDADLARRVLTTVVFNLLLPALVLSVLWRAKIGLESLKISLFGIVVVVVGAASAWLLLRLWRIDRPRLGAAMLGIAFPNVTYLGLPVLEHAFGPASRSIVIQIDLFGVTPMVLTLGVMIGSRYGMDAGHSREPMWATVLANPPLWAAAIAVSMNLNGSPMPHWLDPMLEKLADAVIPLMLISLGMGLQWSSWRRRNIPLSALVLGLKLMAMPWFGVALGLLLGFSGDQLAALVMEAGMPSMLMGVVLCDRYQLDTGFYAMIVTLTTLAGLITVSFWHELMT